MSQIGKIKNYCTVIAGQSPKGSAYNDKGEGMEFHQGKKSFGKDLLESSGVWTTEITKVAEAGDILMSVRAPVGPTNRTDRRVCIGRGLAAIRCKENVSPQYILYSLKNIESNIVGKDGAVFNSINKDMIEDLPVPDLPLSEQQRIVDILDKEFAKIDELKSNAELNLRHAKDLFQAALKKELEPKEGWTEKSIPEISENLDSKRVPVTKRDRVNGVFPYYGASGIVDYVNKYIFDEDLLLVSEDGANLLARVYPIAFSISGKTWVNNHAHVLRFKDSSLQRFVEYYFAATDLSMYISGMAQPKFNQKSLNSIRVSFPIYSSETSRIVDKLDELNAKCKVLQENYTKTVALCDDLKQSLLRKAFNGEL